MKNTILSILFGLFGVYTLHAQCFSEQIFNTPGQSTFSVPGTAAENYIIEIETRGADGGDFLWGGNPQTNGGEGATLKGSFVVPGGSELLVVVGASGMDAPGSPGGGGGGGGGSGTGGGGGGGYKGGDGASASSLSGKGGDSFLNSLYSGTIIFNTPGTTGGGDNVNGMVVITCIPQGDVELNLVSAVDPLCFGGFGGSIEVMATGGLAPYQYALNGGVFGDSPIFDGLMAGDYTVSVQDGAGDTDMIMVSLASSPEIIGEVVYIVDNVCFGSNDGSIEVTASGGTSINGTYGYSINGGSVQNSGLFFNLANGFYVISIFDDNLCTAQVTATISSPDDLELVLISKQDVSCAGANDGSCSVSAFGGTPDYQYSIDGGAFGDDFIFTGLSGGPHTIQVADAEDCMEELVISIEEPESINFDVNITDVICYGDSNGVIEVINVSGIAPFTFALEDGSPDTSTIFQGLMAGTYGLAVVDSAGCEVIEEVQVDGSEDLGLTVEVLMDVLCGGDSTGVVQLATQNGNGSITYSINQNLNFSGLFENLPAGEYTAVATDSMGCVDESLFEIVELTSFGISVSSLVHVSCNGGEDGSITVSTTDAVPPIQYAINGSAYQDTSFFDGLSAGEYYLEVMDSSSCVQMLTVEIEEPMALNFDYLALSHVACHGDMSGQLDYSFQGGSPPYMAEFNGAIDTFLAKDTLAYHFLGAGDFELMVTDVNGCVFTDTISILENDALAIVIKDEAGDECGEAATGLIEIEAQGGVEPYFYFIDSTMQESALFDSLSAGTYLISVEDSLGCSIDLEVNVPQLEGLTLDSMTIGSVSCHGDSDGYVEFFVSNAVGDVFATWVDIVYTGLVIDGLSAGSYSFGVVDESGCYINVDVTIPEPEMLVVEVITADLGEGTLTVSASGGSEPYRYSIDDKVSFQDSATFVGLETGEYTIIVIDDNGCEAEVMYALVDVEDIVFSGLSIYPNPVRGDLYFDLDGDFSEVRIDLFDRFGRLVKKQGWSKDHLHQKSYSMDIEDIVPGIYFVRLTIEGKTASRKIVISR